MRWAIEIENTQLDRRNLADLLARLGYVVVEAAPNIAFTSGDVDRCTSADDVNAIGERVREGFAGAADIDKEFRLGPVIDYFTEPPRRHYFLKIQSTFHFQHTASATLTIEPPQGQSAEDREFWEIEQSETAYRTKLEAQLSLLEPAFFNPKAAKVLELLSNKEPTGETLYKIYELMRGPRANKDSFGERFGISSSEYAKFSEAVHKDSVSGDWARHAHGDPPARGVDPMSKSEAEAFVRRM